MVYLVPLALEILDANLLSEGDFYPGDLLCSVLRLDSLVWKQHPDWAERLKVSKSSKVEEFDIKRSRKESEKGQRD